ncbi:MAG: diguanylate cyclase and metal dependent phosphohydrolase [Chloroflexi bacterium CSP1-4]|nr:MAG: diguanylate cyclase and metal dependent phosphohydrolase [Chloroflexi bacterium CSP1-4]
MLLLLRLLGLLAPIALTVRFLLLPDLAPALSGTVGSDRVVLDSLAFLTGVGITSLVVSLIIGRRLGRLSRGAERIVQGDYEVRLPVGRGAVEARLARSLNTIAEHLSETYSAATTDKLTQVANRPTVLAELFDEVERANRYERPLTVAFVDIDHFKSVNDTYGHHAGDIVLRHVAELLRTNIRATDRIGRYGGEEFILILTETEAQEAAGLAEKLRMLVMRERIDIEAGAPVGVTISIGVAGGIGKAVRFDTIVRDADAAMFSAKNLGRNQTYVFAEPDEDSRIPRAPVSAEGRESAIEIGRAARAAAEGLLHSVIRPLPHYRGKPSELIAEVATTMARNLDLPQAEIDRIRVASLLHDVGKVAIPSQILDKPAPLTNAEWQAVVQHPRVGQLILEHAGSLRDAVPIILHHHERYGGDGYPYGLRGQDIPLGARIVAVADAYDAMMHDRPYKMAMGHLRAIAELRRHAGRQFDPRLVELFCDLFSSGVIGFAYDGDRMRDEAEPGGSRRTGPPRASGRTRRAASG